MNKGFKPYFAIIRTADVCDKTTCCVLHHVSGEPSNIDDGARRKWLVKHRVEHVEPRAQPVLHHVVRPD